MATPPEVRESLEKQVLEAERRYEARHGTAVLSAELP